MGQVVLESRYRCVKIIAHGTSVCVCVELYQPLWQTYLHAKFCGIMVGSQRSKGECAGCSEGSVYCVCFQGDHMEWLGCALYVAGQSQQLETMEGQAREGNSVSLTQILRATKLK